MKKAKSTKWPIQKCFSTFQEVVEANSNIAIAIDAILNAKPFTTAKIQIIDRGIGSHKMIIENKGLIVSDHTA